MKLTEARIEFGRYLKANPNGEYDETMFYEWVACNGIVIQNDEDPSPCTRKDLLIVLNEPHYWGVQDNGQADFGDYQNSGGSADDFDSYYCDNCAVFFTAEPREQAWHETLAHLPKQEAAQ